MSNFLSAEEEVEKEEEAIILNFKIEDCFFSLVQPNIEVISPITFYVQVHVKVSIRLYFLAKSRH